MKQVTVICSNDYPYEVCFDAEEAEKRRKELQEKSDHDLGFDSSGNFIGKYNTHRRIYFHTHTVSVHK